jgi:hypothetical protein
MGDREDLVSLVQRRFSFLEEDLALRKQVTDERHSTSVAYLGTDLAFEFEFDWYDLDIFVFVVRLESGSLPDGYYVSEDGSPCRWSIRDALVRYGIGYEPVLRIRSQVKKKRRWTRDYLEDLVEAYSQLLTRDIAEKVIHAGLQVFKEDKEGDQSAPGADCKGTP